jgi:hypothetical protein
MNEILSALYNAILDNDGPSTIAKAQAALRVGNVLSTAIVILPYSTHTRLRRDEQTTWQSPLTISFSPARFRLTIETGCLRPARIKVAKWQTQPSNCLPRCFSGVM